MKHRHCQGTLVLLWTLLLLLVASSWAQESSNPLRVGIPQDWSQHHVIFSRSALVQHPELAQQEARIVHQAIQRWQGARPLALNRSTSVFPVASQRDWSVTLGNGRIAPDMFPAKYSFDPGAPPDCNNDYVVMGLNVAGAVGHQANLVAFNNLYAGIGGICATGPTVMFAYDITTVGSGRILTSPALSLDGKKIAFVEAGSATAVFHVLTWETGNGSIGHAAVPGTGNSAVDFHFTLAAALDSRSSPWIDYNTDTAYVGADDGRVYKILNVFKGTPALAGAPWPVPVSPNQRLTGPVLDVRLGVVLVGSANGTLYSINTSTGAVKSVVVGRSGSRNSGILASPLVDISNGTSFAVSSNDGTSGVLVEVDTATMTQLAKARIGIASKSGTSINLYEPAFSNDYFNDPSTGVVRLCGTGFGTDITPWQYAFGFTGRTMNTTPVFSQQLLTSTAASCSPWTEFFNPNVGTGGTDFFFFGLSAECTGTGSAGCVVARTNDDAAPRTTATVPGGTSGIVVDNWSTAGQASSIYFTGETTPNTAYKFTQNGLL